ncbi:agmatinase [Nitrosopumilus sp. K4]|uniref:agmatinase n=1 Tax=Nitrosopumilus sp. K4 TaxID=2795383 RepID=UPI001BA4DA58|nr:agmatinase [Nitrosopumilus sp. K4]QUC64145.1 agmatinase [Nitrosopumilus sp. K4]
MEKICWDNSQYVDSDVVIIGIPDESQSHSMREGTSKAPDQIRIASNLMDSYTRNEKKSLGLPVNGISKHVCDYGNIARNEIPQTFEKIFSDSKIPISIGGDHSMSSQIIRQLSHKSNRTSLVYFDAHPDFVTSTKNYYGSVFGDVLDCIEPKTSIQIGIRTPEQEELDNLQENQIHVITPFEIAEKGISKISQQVLDILGDDVYVSFDMDCIDPSYAPGVSVPVPMGLSSVDTMYLLKKIADRGILGMDLVEVCPPYDINNRTSHLASRMIGEVISSIK